MTRTIPGGMWDEGKDQELVFQTLKRSDAYLFSIQEGTMLPSEYSAADEATAAQRVQQIAKLRSKRTRAALKKASLLKGRILPTILVGSQIYLDVSTDVRTCSAANPNALAAMRGCDVVRARHAAECFLVENPAKLAPETMWSVCLNGGLVVDVEFLQHGNGSAVTYMPAIQSGGTHARPRIFWCSDKFKGNHASLYAILVASSVRAESVWREVGRAAWCTEVEKDQKRPQRQRRGLNAIAIVNDDRQANKLGLPNVFHPGTFIEKFRQVTRGSAGICGL